MMKVSLIWLLLVMSAVVSACGAEKASTMVPDATPAPPAAHTSGSTESGRVITGEEALELYGIGDSPTPGPATATPQIWFTAKAWVVPSMLPYDPSETINFLPVYSTPGLGDPGLWLGDLETGQEVVLHGITQDGLVCLVEGTTIQGWGAKGWVSCSRLEFVE
jgi:hypothetical protein